MLAIAVIVLDQFSKFLAQQQGLVTLNPGISWGIFNHWPEIALTIGISLVALALAMIGRNWWLKWPLVSGVFWGGVVGNLIDRWLFNGVRDWWPVPALSVQNNLADWAISFSVVAWLIIELHATYRSRSNSAL